MPTPLSCLGLLRAAITLDAKLGGDYWDRTSRAISGGFTVRCITIDASSPNLAAQPGLEPGTNGLTVRCSTN